MWSDINTHEALRILGKKYTPKAMMEWVLPEMADGFSKTADGWKFRIKK
jgi:hypothetical protein